MSWTDSASPRIWRSGEADFYGDEPLRAPEVYTHQTLGDIAAHGFNGVWLRGRLYELMQSLVLPELNDRQAPDRLNNLRTVIERGRRAGVGIWLFFNEPLAPREDHPLWKKHPDLGGVPYVDPLDGVTYRSLCTLHPLAARFFAEGTRSLIADLPGLAGVILITASEHHSHCHSHHVLREMGDGFTKLAEEPLACPRCRPCEPAGVVGDLLKHWREAVQGTACQVLAWNWSWSMWYPDPQAPVIQRIPAGVRLLADFERGGRRPWRGREIHVDEYSLAYAGPSERFCGAQDAAQRQTISTCAKLQLGATHEIATVPNIPVITNVHAKLAAMERRGVGGFMGTWNFGCTLTLNTAAVRLFCDAPSLRQDVEGFCHELARSYLGVRDGAAMLKAWRCFAAAVEHFPFSLKFIYFGPVNAAPARPMSLHYNASPLKPTWLKYDDYGDRYEDCADLFTLTEAADSLGLAADVWREGLSHMNPAVQGPAGTAQQQHHRRQEWSCAQMIAIQLRSAAHLLAFHDWRLRKMQQLERTAPCDLPPDDTSRALMEAELRNLQPAMELAAADPRLGYHQEARWRMYDEPSVARKRQRLQQEAR